MRERVVTFGGGLVGVLTEGEGTPAPWVVVLPNAYATPKTGLFRFHVELARALAPRGFSTLRFDVTGLGDSPARPDAGTLAQRYRVDLRHAVRAALGETGTQEVALIGHCDGAMHAFTFALEEPCVRALVAIDGALVPNARDARRRRWRKLRRHLDLRVWLERVQRKLDRHVASEAHASTMGGDPQPVRTSAELPEDTLASANALRARGTRLRWIFSGEAQRYSQTDRTRAAFGLLDGEVHESPAARHVLPEAHARERLATELGRWLMDVTRQTARSS